MLRAARRYSAVAVGLAVPLLAMAQGGPPLLTDDPDTPGDRRWEINIAHELEGTADEIVHNLPRLDVNYGLGDRIQLKVETAWLATRDTDGEEHGGLDNPLVGVKWRFYDAGDAGFKASVYPQLEVQNHASVERGVAERAPNLALPIEVARSLGAVRVAGELGYTIMRAGPNQWFYGVAAARQASPGLELLAEIHGTAEDAPRKTTDLVLDFGFRKDIRDHATVLASLGTGVAGDAQRSRVRSYLGLQLHF